MSGVSSVPGFSSANDLETVDGFEDLKICEKPQPAQSNLPWAPDLPGKDQILVIAGWVLTLCRSIEVTEINLQFEWSDSDHEYLEHDASPVLQFAISNDSTIGEFLRNVEEVLAGARHDRICISTSPSAVTSGTKKFSSKCLIIKNTGSNQAESRSPEFASIPELCIYPETKLDEEASLEIRPRPRPLDQDWGKLLLARLEAAVVSIRDAEVETGLSSVTLQSMFERQHIERLLGEAPCGLERCVHEMISDHVHRDPSAAAVAAWDVELTYAELDDLSTKLAGSLVKLGLRIEDKVALCFDKSGWAVVANVAILKAGAAAFNLGTTTPRQRMETMLRQAQCRIILTDRNHGTKLRGMAPTVLDVNQQVLSALPEPEKKLPDVAANNVAYIMFTSGSTGMPKGIVTEHGSICSSISAHSKRWGIGPGVRVFNFAAYTFDISVADNLLTLACGGTICVPSESERLDDLAGAITKYRSSWAFLTPTVAATLTPETVPTLRNIFLSGEASTKSLLAKWALALNLIVSYGPAEASVHCAGTMPVQDSNDPQNVGHALGCRMWVLDQNASDSLALINTVGEIVVEGRIVSRGYLANQSMTEKSYIWTRAWSTTQVRVYRTGDLGRVNPDGTVSVVGRIDSQVKIRGQRVELGEIEHQFKRVFHAAKNAIAWVASEAAATHALAMFYTPLQTGKLAPSTTKKVSKIHLTDPDLINGLRDAQKKLEGILPNYMIPSLYIPVTAIPLTANGKTDRQILSQMIDNLSDQDIRDFSLLSTQDVIRRDPSSQCELDLRNIIAKHLQLPAESIGVEDDFFRLGGNSLLAIKICAAARQSSLPLTVQIILESPTIERMAHALDNVVPGAANAMEPRQPFDLLQGSYNENMARGEFARQCRVDERSITDAFPCTPIQEIMFLESLKAPGSYVVKYEWIIPHSIDIERFRRAWEAVYRANEIIRTRLVESSEGRLVQAVVDDKLYWQHYEAGAVVTKQPIMGLGQQLYRFSLLQAPVQSSEWRFVLEAHHSVIDGWTLNLLLQALTEAYNDVMRPPEYRYRDFVEYTGAMNREGQSEFWAQLLYDEVPSTLPSQREGSRAQSEAQGRIHNRSTAFTVSDFVKAAWAVVLSELYSHSNIILGVVESGRDSALPGIELIAGPTLATVPFPVQVRERDSIDALLQGIHRLRASMIPYLHCGMREISATTKNAEKACQLRNLIVVQPVRGDEKDDGLLLLDPVVKISLQDCDLILECQLHQDSVSFNLDYNTAYISSSDAQALLRRLASLFETLQTSNSSALLQTLAQHDSADRATIQRWNANLPVEVKECVHHLITSQALRTPDAMATEGWDGCLTYQQLDESANQLACRLVDQGIAPGQRVPVISEKSIFYVVTLLAILKTGACFVPLEPSQPAQRLHEIFKVLSATHCLVTPETKKAIAVPGCKLIEPSVLVNLDAACNSSEPAFSAPGGQSAKLAYVIFTSGSTGKPKGVMVSHAALNAGALARAHLIQRTKRSRVFAFSSHSFDTSIEDVLTTLVVGGCICVPSSYERNNNLAGAIERYRANTLDTTPSVAATIDPRTVPGLETLILGGEAVTTDNVQTWSSHVRMFNTYGPSECAIVSTVSEILKDSIAINIGRGAGCITWIVDENNHNRLMPVGDVGELLIEGPIVGDGYVGNEYQTKQSFIPTTKWRSTFNYGQNWPMYKTGDLVKYAADGTLLFLGRKDSQIKLRGQRIELTEIEHALREATADYKIRVAVDFIKISEEQSVIVGFLCDLPYMRSSLPSLLRAGSSHNAIMLMESHLAATLPSYMLPSYYIVLHDLPTTTSGKLDRKTLRELFFSEYKGLQTASERQVVLKEQPRHHVELALQSLWGRILGISPSQIGCPDNFFALGGNSLSAMQLVNSCVTLGLKLSLTDVFKSSSLQSMSESVIAKMGVPDTFGDKHVESSCSLMGRAQAETILMEAFKTHDLQSSNVQDMYPASALQDSFIRGSLQTPGAYIATHVFSIDRSISRHEVEQAWAAVVQQCDILRMRLFHVEQYGTIQVVMHHQTTVLSEVLSVQDEMNAAKSMKIDFGTPLWKASLVKDSALTFVWTAHHSVYDGWTLDCLASALSAQCREVDYRYKPYRDFIQHISDIDKPVAEKYWRKSLENTTQIGRLTNNTSTFDSSRQTIASTIDFCPGQQSRLQDSTYILAAWALTLSQYTESPDIVFGNTSTGRTGSLSDLQQIIGPTMTVSPMRVVINQSVTVSDYLRAIQDQRAEMLQFDQLGIQRIRELSDDCSRACDFETLLDIHTHMVTKHSRDAFELQTSQAVNKTFHTHALVLTCTMSHGSVHIDFDYNQSLISQVLARRLVSHFQHMLLQLVECADGRPESTLADLEIITPAEAAQIIAWNASPHKIVDQCIHDVVLAKVKEAPQAQAVYGWDASFTYEELAHLSSRLAFHLLSLNLGSKPIIPLCFSKSAWTVVAMLAVLRVGGSYVALDTSHPTERLRSIVQKTRSNIVLVAPEFKSIFENQVSSVFVLDRNISERLHDSGALDARTNSSPSDAAMICFTSGSTGNPKGVVLQHDAFCTLAESVQEELQLSATSRVLQFAAYAFDVSNAEIFLTLMKGGCCCIPSEYDRLNDLSGVITRMEINWLYLTPTAATFVTAKDISSVRTLVLGGEAARQELIDRFASCTRLVNSYGPAEGTIWPSLARLSSDSLPADIGCGSGCNMWLVDASNHQRLVPLGTTGEIVLEGPLVARGYLFDEVATRAAFIEPPSWAAQANNESQRFYKVGDLARQNRDGTLRFVGRKDSQRKLRGQRIELGEIEYCISSSGKAFNAAAVEVVTTVENVQALVAFICPDTSIKAEYRNNIATMTPYLMEELQELRTMLAQTLPSYMVPTFFVPMKTLPTSLSRKLDRKSLRFLMEKLTAQELLSFTLSRTQHKKAPISEEEFEMRSLWSQVLNLNVEDVGMDDNPTSLGVNSFLAIKLSGQARKRGIVMSVAEILRTNSLRALASSVQRTTIESRIAQPFGLLHLASKTDILQIRKDVDSFCGADAGELLDAYPCTAMQEGMLMLSQKEEGAYVAQRVFSIAPGAERDDLQRAWNVVAQRCDILRTRLIPSSRYGTLQVVIDDRIDWKQATELHDYLLKDKHQVFDYGQPMMRYCLVHDQENKITHFVWTTHHAVYDGWTINRVLALVNQSYYGKELTPQPPFRRFIESIHTQQVEDSSRKFWSDYLDGYCSSASILSQSSQITSTDHARSTTTTHVIKLCDQSACPVTMPTVIQTAWALLLGRHNNYAETSFGLVLNGRNVPVPDILEICGPTMTTIPVRVRVDPKSSIHDLLHDTQEQRLLGMPYEHLGLRSIQKLSPAAQMACSFESLLVIDTIFENTPGEQPQLLLESMNQTTLPASANFSGYPLTMTATISEGEVHLEAEFNSNRLETDWVTRAMQDMEMLIGALIAASSTTKISQACSKSSLHDSSDAGYQLGDQAVGPNKSVKSGDTHPGFSKVGTKSEDVLRRLWCEVLQLDPTNIDDNTSFLELGGDSVLAMRLAALARRVGFKLTVRQILQKPTLKDMAQAFLSPPASPLIRIADKREAVLRRLWSEVLQIDPQHIDDSTNFLELGGDSVLAMRLAALARKAGLQLTVRRILQKPTLAGMAQSFHGYSAPSQPTPIQNVWLEDPKIHEHILGQTKISRSDISDIAPVTDFQAWSIASDRLASRGFSNYLILTFTQELPLQQLFNAVKGIVRNNSILRTAFISYEGQLLQVVRNEPVIEHTHIRIPYDSPSRTIMHAHIKDQLQGRSALRIGHTRLITIGSSSENIAQMAVSLSHAQFDAISLSELCNDLAAEFDGRPSAQRPLFADFARRVVDQSAQNKAREFWSRILKDSRLTPVAAPTVSRPHSYKYPLSKDHVRHIEAPCTNRFTFATFLKTAWALVLTQQSGRDDVVFGHLVSGRASDLGDIETAVGPCINLIPVRLNTAGRSKVSELLAEVHDQYLTAIPHETLGFSHIIRDCTSWPRQSRFSTIVQHQNVDDLPTLTLARDTVSVEVDLYCPPHDATDVWVISQPTSEGMKIALTCNEDLIPDELANKLLDSLVGFIWLLAHDLEQPERSRQGSASSKGVAADENTVVSSTQATMVHIWQKALAPSEYSALVIPMDIPFYELRGDLAAAALLQDAYYSEFQLEVSMEELIDRPSLKEHLQIVLARRLSVMK